MRIVFMGTPDFAVPCLQRILADGHEVPAVFTQPDKPVGRHAVLTPPPVKQLAQERGIPVYQPTKMRDGTVAAQLKELAPDCLVVVAYGRILPQAILDVPPKGCINIHGSLLPKYRGAAPIQWSVINGEKITGVTSMFMDAGMDTGDIIDTITTPIGENETAGELFDRLAPLGADISASVYLEPDGSFPNHVPNPENKEAMESLRRAVLAGGCDLGLIFDTDVDRAGAVEADGTELGRNRLIALAAAIAAEQAPDSTIVTDSVTSDQLADFIEKKLGCRHHRFKRGYKNVINEAIRLNEAGETCLLAMETSGHGALKENYFLDDGAYLATKIVIRYAQLRRQGRTLADLLDGMREPLEAQELRFRLLPEDFQAAGAAVLAALERYAASQPGWVPAPHNYEGLRYAVPAQKGWFLLRMSLHYPLMPLNIESDCPDGSSAILRELTPFLTAQPALDTTILGHNG